MSLKSLCLTRAGKSFVERCTTTNYIILCNMFVLIIWLEGALIICCYLAYCYQEYSYYWIVFLWANANCERKTFWQFRTAKRQMKIITQNVFVVEGGSHSYHRSINILFSITINETKKTDIFANEQSSWGTNMGDLLQSACHLEYTDN